MLVCFDGALQVLLFVPDLGKIAVGISEVVLGPGIIDLVMLKCVNLESLLVSFDGVLQVLLFVPDLGKISVGSSKVILGSEHNGPGNVLPSIFLSLRACS